MTLDPAAEHVDPMRVVMRCGDCGAGADLGAVEEDEELLTGLRLFLVSHEVCNFEITVDIPRQRTT